MTPRPGEEAEAEAEAEGAGSRGCDTDLRALWTRKMMGFLRRTFSRRSRSRRDERDGKGGGGGEGGGGGVSGNPLLLAHQQQVVHAPAVVTGGASVHIPAAGAARSTISCRVLLLDGSDVSVDLPVSLSDGCWTGGRVAQLWKHTLEMTGFHGSHTCDGGIKGAGCNSQLESGLPGGKRRIVLVSLHLQLDTSPEKRTCFKTLSTCFKLILINYFFVFVFFHFTSKISLPHWQIFLISSKKIT